MPSRLLRLKRRFGLSLMELLSCVAILGIVAAVIIPRLQSGAKDCNEEACRVQKGIIEIQAVLWKRQNGTYPSSDLSDIGRSSKYFPDGLPTCPVDGSPYVIDSNGRIRDHIH